MSQGLPSAEQVGGPRGLVLGATWDEKEGLLFEAKLRFGEENEGLLFGSKVGMILGATWDENEGLLFGVTLRFGDENEGLLFGVKLV